MLAIEKDLGQVKKQFDSKTQRSDVGIKPETLSQTLQKSMIQSYHHNTIVRRRKFDNIIKENKRMYHKLRDL